MTKLFTVCVAGAMLLPLSLEAQALFQSGEGKGSFFSERTGSLFALNFSDKSIEFNQTHSRTDQDVRFGIRLKATASDGYGALYDSDKGFGTAQGEVGGLIGWVYQNLESTGQTGLLDFRVYGDVSYSQASFSLVSGSDGGSVARSDSTFRGARIKLVVNSFMGRVTRYMNLLWGVSGSVGETNNYKYIPKLQYCEETSTAASGATTRKIQSCKDARKAEAYSAGSGSEATADVILLQPWLERALGVPGAVDFFGRYEQVRPDHPRTFGVGVFLSPAGKPRNPFGGITFQRVGSKTKVGLQAAVSF